ncbi:MAG: class I fructose-bisphosphate aldolase [Streptosporangiaceae bacterium]
MDALGERASALVAPPKGILATGPGGTAMSGRLAAAGVPPTGENRRAFRELLVTAPGLRAGITGVILDAEGMHQRSAAGQPLPEAIGAAGLMTGVRADAGLHPLPGTCGETVTEGLDGLPGRLEEWARAGAVFATWRAVLRIGAGTPSAVAVRANAQALGRYAAACQAAGLVPVVAPHLDGGGPHSGARHSLAQCETAMSLMLLAVMGELDDYGVDPAAVVLKPTMTVPRRGAAVRSSAAESAEATVRTLGAVPITLAGVAFAAGTQRPERATGILAAMQSIPHIWPLTFAFGRPLTGPALDAWGGRPGRWVAGQRALAYRVAMNIAAMEGRYTPELDLDAA